MFGPPPNVGVDPAQDYNYGVAVQCDGELSELKQHYVALAKQARWSEEARQVLRAEVLRLRQENAQLHAQLAQCGRTNAVVQDQRSEDHSPSASFQQALDAQQQYEQQHPPRN
jgi:hypothetical protein